MKRNWELEELVEHWTLLPRELRLLTYKSDPNRLGLALLLKFFQYAGHFPSQRAEIPSQAIHYVGQQLKILPKCFEEYNWQGRTLKSHRAKIRSFLGFRQTKAADTKKLSEWLQTQVLAYEMKLELLKEAALAYLRANRLEPLSSKSLERLVRSALNQFEQHFCQVTVQQLSSAIQSRLDELLQAATVEESENYAPLTSTSLLT